jgi:hypothetical protein
VSPVEDVVALRREISEELAQAWHDRMLDRLVGIVRIKPWADLHEPTRAGYRTRVAWLVTPVLHLVRRHQVVVMVGGPDVTDGPHMPFGHLCGVGVGPFECSRAAGHPPDFHATGDGTHVVAVWKDGPR